MERSTSAARCEELPLPELPKRMASGAFLLIFTRSSIDFAPSEGRASSISGASPTSEIALKSESL